MSRILLAVPCGPVLNLFGSRAVGKQLVFPAQTQQGQAKASKFAAANYLGYFGTSAVSLEAKAHSPK